MKLRVAHETFPLASVFTISRGAKTAADVILVTLEDNGLVGHGEGVPYSRYNETCDNAIAALETSRPTIEGGITRQQAAQLQLPRSAANALDCALWDLEAKRTGKPVWKLAGLSPPSPATTAYTISLAAPEEMARAAAAASRRPLLKLKLGREGDIQRLNAVRAAAPDCRLVVDANEGWEPGNLARMLDHCQSVGVELVEQPLPAGNDAALAHIPRIVPICADESAHGLASLAELAGKYDAINIKLDKTGGLTPALELAHAARAQGLRIMVGCMVGTSLGMAPALMLSHLADWVDLDGPLILKQDRTHGLTYQGSTVHPPSTELWG